MIDEQFIISDSRTRMTVIDFIANAPAGVTVDIKTISKQRTNRQNRALHLYYTLVSSGLRDGGWDRSIVMGMMENSFTVEWTPVGVKEGIWQPVQKSLYGTTSTKDLDTEHVDMCQRQVDKWLLEHLSLDIPFPTRLG